MKRMNARDGRRRHPSERELRRTRKKVEVALARASLHEDRDALLTRYCLLVLEHGSATSGSHVHRAHVDAGAEVERLAGRYSHLPLDDRTHYERRAETVRAAARALRKDVPARLLRACAVMTALVTALIFAALLLR